MLIYLLMAATTPALLATGLSAHEALPFRVPPLDPPAGSSLATLMRDLPHYELSPKYQVAATIVAKNAAEGRKTLVWSTFVRNLTSLAHLLSAYHPAIVYGDTEDRGAQLHKFRHDPECFVLLSNPATLGEGVSLHQTCHDAVYVDRDFSRAGSCRASTASTAWASPGNGYDDQCPGCREDGRRAGGAAAGGKLDFLGTILDDPAVLELADLQEEDTLGAAGMEDDDLTALADLLRGVPAT